MCALKSRKRSYFHIPVTSFNDLGKGTKSFFLFCLQRIRWYCMVSTPFIVFYIIGIIFQSGLDYLIKLGAFLTLYTAVYLAKNLLFDERLFHILPISIYLATKVSLIVLTRYLRIHENRIDKILTYEHQLRFILVIVTMYHYRDKSVHDKLMITRILSEIEESYQLFDYRYFTTFHT